jgi:hypothetical protein
MKTEDGKRVIWGTTIRYLLIRSVAAGLVATAIIAVGVPLERLFPPELRPPLYLMPLVWTVLVFCIFGTAYVFGKMCQLFPEPMPVFGSLIINLATLLAFLACIIGDPIVWLANKFVPSLINIRDLKFINPYFFIYVYAPDDK